MCYTDDVRRKMNIAMLGQKHIPGREGGVEVVVEELAVRMVKRGYKVTCFNRSGHHVSGAQFDIQQTGNYKGVHLVSVPTVNRKGFAAVTSSVSGAIRAAFGAYNVVHFHAEGPAIMCWLPKLMGKRVIVTIHGLDWQRAKWGKLASFYILAGEKSAVHFADEIIVLSHNAQTYFEKRYGRKTRYIPNGINRNQKIPVNEIKREWALLKGGYILYLGRIVPEKGLRNLILAFRHVKTNKKLIIAGGLSDTKGFGDKLKRMAEGDSRIIFTGFVQGTVLRELYSNAYLYVLPSDLEGMPVSLLEAMSFGNCCLTSDIPECTEVVADKGLSFRRGDVFDLQKKLQELCDHPEVVKKYQAQAADYICAKYNWDSVTDETLALYRGVE